MFLFIGLNSFAQSDTDVGYSYLEVKNASGHNFVDFKLSYDKYSTCDNNIYIIAIDDINIYFQIYLNGYKVYDGWAKMSAGQKYFLNNAFIDCTSSKKEVLIKTQSRS